MNIEMVVSRLKSKIAEKEALLSRYDDEGFAAGYMNLDGSITELKAILSDIEKCLPVMDQRVLISHSHPANAMRDRLSVNSGLMD